MIALRTRWLPLFVCAVWTALLGWLWLSGTYMNYLNIKLWPLLAVGGGLGLLFTLALLWPTAEAAAATSCCGHEHGHGHEHHHEHEHAQACEHEHGGKHDHHHHHHEHPHGDCGGHAPPARCCGDEGGCEESPPRAGVSVLTRSGPWLQAALVLLPVLYLVRTPGAQLDSYAFALRQVETPAPQQTQPEEQAAPVAVVEAPASTQVTLEVEANVEAEAQALPGADAASAGQVVEAKPALPVNLLQIGRGLAEFKGERIVTEGMYFRGERVPRLHFVLFRFSITCCAADAMPLSVLVKDAPQMPDVDVDQWVRVEGVVQSMEFEGRQTGVVVAEKVTPIETPDNPFMIDTGPNGGGW